MVTDLNGRAVTTQTITDANGVLDVDTCKWAAGNNVYAFVVDGRTLARKKMLVQ